MDKIKIMTPIETKFEELKAEVQTYLTPNEVAEVERAFNFAKAAHGDQKRKTGEAYIYHPVAAAQILAEMQLDGKLVVAALLHDVPEDTSTTLKEIETAFGADIASLVEGITKLANIKYRGIERYIENLRKMFLAMAADLRVILIKFADRLHNLRTLHALTEEKQIRIASEVLEIYAPIASRLGMFEMKSLLEDEAFKYVNAKEYAWMDDLIKNYFEPRQPSIENIISEISNSLTDNNISVIDIRARRKHLYSLYKKLLRYERNPARINDFTAIRIIVDSVPECYQVLGVIHNIFVPMKGRFKDYIAQPKPNGYQSLHSTLFCKEEEGRTFEVQIRTQQMDREAEFGVAAHWNYKEKGAQKISKSLKWIQELTKWSQEFAENQKFLENLKLDVFKDRIFVFTPKGDVIELPDDATVIDFAYHVHTELGNQCIGVIINNHIASLDSRLKSGDVVEILRNKSRKYPNPDWMKFVKTTMAKSKIKAGLKNRSLLEKFLHR